VYQIKNSQVAKVFSTIQHRQAAVGKKSVASQDRHDTEFLGGEGPISLALSKDEVNSNRFDSKRGTTLMPASAITGSIVAEMPANEENSSPTIIQRAPIRCLVPGTEFSEIETPLAME